MAWNALVNKATGQFYPGLIPNGGGIPLTKGQLISANALNVEVPVTAPAFPAQEGWVLTATAAAVDGTGLEWKDAGQASFTGVGQMQYGGAAPDFDDTPLNLGTAGQILKVNPGATAPIWADPQGATPFTAVGQMQYGGPAAPPPGFADTPLNLGTAGQILKVNVGATAPEWADVAGETIVAGPGLTITNPAINTISINQGFLNKGDLIVGTGQNEGVIVPCPAFDQSLVLGTSTTTPTGLEWKTTGGGYSGPTINRSSGIDPVLINAPTTASDTMICVADHPNDESWVAISSDPINTRTGQQRNFPFIDSANNVYRFYDVFTSSPVDGSPLPAVEIVINYPGANDPRKCVFFLTDPGDPTITPSINGCFENSGFVWIYGSFGSIAMFEGAGFGPGPAAVDAGCVVAAFMAGQTPIGNPALVNDILDGQGNCGVTCNDFAVGGPPRINCGFYSPWFYDEGQGPYNNLVFAGYFDAQYQTGGLPVSTDMQNIIIYDTITTGPKWFDSGQMDIRKMATTLGPTGEVFTGYVQTNIAAPCQVYGGKFTSVDYNPTPRSYLGILNFPGGDGNAAAWVAAPPTALTGDVQYCIASGTNVNTGLIQGAFGTFGAVGGGLAYFDLLTGVITQINLASLPASSIWTDTYYGLCVANIKADPISPAVLHDVCVFNVPNVGAISYRTPCTGVGAGTWVLNPNPTGQVTNSDVKCIMYGVVAEPAGLTFPNPSLYVLDNEANLNSTLKYLKQGNGTPLSAIFQLSPAVAGTCQFRTGGVSVFTICTMEESTAQYFMASPQQNVPGKFDWVCMGQPQATTIFT